MNQKLIDFNKSQKRTDIPEIQTGDIVRVHKKIIEGDKQRIQIIKGLVISIKGKQSSSPTITVRRDSQGIGVEMIFPIYLPAIEKIEVLRHSKVRESKIYYMRKRSGKSAKMRIKDFSDKEKQAQKEERATAKADKEAVKKTETENQEKRESEKSTKENKVDKKSK
jgi:large subunit ribosomal protein L19